MAYQTILALAGDDPAWQPATDAGRMLASVFNAHLIGLYVHEAPYNRRDFVYPFASGDAMLTDWETDEELATDRIQAVHREFEASTRAAGLEVDWRYAAGRMPDVLSAAARSADLICLGVYGRSKIRELVLGGVTRGLLHDDPIGVPLFFAH